MLKELQDIGLSEKEAKVYLAALEIGRATADQLAKQAKIVRSTTYVQLESLMKKGLVSTYEEGKKTYFAPESPEYLKRILELKKHDLEVREKELGDFLPLLVQKFEGAGERPIVRFFSGKEGITAMREETLKDLKSGDTLYVMYSYDALFKVYPLKEIIDFSERREKRGIELKIIYSRKEGKLAAESRGPHSARGYLSSDKFGLKTDFFIFGNKVALMALEGHLFGIIIESSAIAQSMQSIFELIWSLSEKE